MNITYTLTKHEYCWPTDDDFNKGKDDDKGVKYIRRVGEVHTPAETWEKKGGQTDKGDTPAGQQTDGAPLETSTRTNQLQRHLQSECSREDDVCDS